MIAAMRRFLLIVLLVLQPLQWGWANTRLTSETAHAVSHGHANKAVALFEVAPSCALAHADASNHACHDNHTHHITVLGLMSATQPMSGAYAPSLAHTRLSEPVESTRHTRIERPKWPTTTPVVVSL